jgi:hypothetical protein
MPLAAYLRRQAENCLRIARHCFDLSSAERMRLLANELKAKADEIERRENVDVAMFGGSVSSSTRNRNS